jgi:hypothetical protein
MPQHFAVWGRPELLERSMPWYLGQLGAARVRAKAHGVLGAVVAEDGGAGRSREPKHGESLHHVATAAAYLPGRGYLQRQTHPRTLEKYRDLVFETADLLASWPYHERKSDRFVLGPPLIPAQETFEPLVTFNPTFELEYWRFGLATAQKWRVRLGLPKDPKWDNVLLRLSKLPAEGRRLSSRRVAAGPVGASAFRAMFEGQHRAGVPEPRSSRRSSRRWAAARLGRGSRDHAPHLDARDEALGPAPDLGLGLADARDDRDAARRTEKAVDFLLGDATNFQFGRSGMTPRMHLDAGAVRDAETYFPSNGSLLLAVALMVAGGSGVHELNPGFPPNGQWIVHSEGIASLP